MAKFVLRSSLIDRYGTTYPTLNSRIGKLKIPTQRAGRSVLVPEADIEKLDKSFKYALKQEPSTIEAEANLPKKEDDSTELLQETEPENTLSTFKPFNEEGETMPAEDELRAKIDALSLDWAAKKSDFEHKLEKSTEKEDALEDGYNRLLEQQSQSTQAVADMTEMLKSIKDDIGSNGKLSAEKLKAVDTLKEDIPAIMNEKLQPIQEKLEKIEEWTPERVREMVNECIKDPESDACKLIGEMVKPAEEKPSVSELVEHGLSHNSGKELLECETCGPIVIKSLKEDHPEMLEKLLCDPEDNECRLGLKLFTEKELEVKLAEAVKKNEEEGKKSFLF